MNETHLCESLSQSSLEKLSARDDLPPVTTHAAHGNQCCDVRTWQQQTKSVDFE